MYFISVKVYFILSNDIFIVLILVSYNNPGLYEFTGLTGLLHLANNEIQIGKMSRLSKTQLENLNPSCWLHLFFCCCLKIPFFLQ